MHTALLPRLSELEASEVLREEDAWKAMWRCCQCPNLLEVLHAFSWAQQAEEDLKLIQGELQDRVVEMTQARPAALQALGPRSACKALVQRRLVAMRKWARLGAVVRFEYVCDDEDGV